MNEVKDLFELLLTYLEGQNFHDLFYSSCLAEALNLTVEGNYVLL